jgi:hypothetical protein
MLLPFSKYSTLFLVKDRQCNLIWLKISEKIHVSASLIVIGVFYDRAPHFLLCSYASDSSIDMYTQRHAIHLGKQPAEPLDGIIFFIFSSLIYYELISPWLA